MSQGIINTISAEIATHKLQLNEEWTNPSHNTDESDNRIKNLREKVKRLKAIRDELETIFYGKGEE